jgi:hypothetical protein
MRPPTIRPSAYGRRTRRRATISTIIKLVWLVVMLVSIYLNIAAAVFTYRNPLASDWCLVHDFNAVITWQTLDKYQPE